MQSMPIKTTGERFLTAIFKPILLILIPWIGSFLLLRHRHRHMWLAFTAVFAIQLVSCLPIGYIAVAATIEASQQPAANVQMASLYATGYRVSQQQLHGLAGWEGVDIKAGCGEPIYAPFAGTVTFNGLDGYNHIENGRTYEQATMLTIKNDYLEMTLLHGDYLPQVGSQVQKGELIGHENTHGWSTGCHSHVVLRDNGRLVNFLEWQQSSTALAKINNAPMVTADYPLRISWYDPSLGGTNCNHDCSTMASGDKVASWIGGRGGIYAAACPRSNGWHHGLRFVLDGVTYECRDTGGWINCYQPEIYDPALKRQADISYCWVDLLNGSQYSYGSLAYNWSFERNDY